MHDLLKAEQVHWGVNVHPGKFLYAISVRCSKGGPDRLAWYFTGMR